MDQEEKAAAAGNEQQLHNHHQPQMIVVATATLPTTSTTTSHLPPHPPTHARAAEEPAPHFTTLHWSPDGTTLLLPTSHQTLETYILPPDLLTPPPSSSSSPSSSSPSSSSPPRLLERGGSAGGGGGGGSHHHTLYPYHSHALPSPSAATTIHPSFSLASPASCLYLTCPRDLPIRLISPFFSTVSRAPQVLASYPLVHERTEHYVAPHAVVFDHPLLDPGGGTFFAGAGRLVAVFDVTRDGEGPVGVCVLGRKRRRRRRGGVGGYLAAGREDAGMGMGMGSGGMVSAMDVGVERGVLAAGMFKGKGVGLVDVRGGEEAGVVGTLPLPQGAGDGVTGVKFCPAVGRGDYLIVAERVSEVMHVFDVRNGGGVLATLKGREALTNQRLGVDVTADGAVWAGGTDGMVRVWEDVGLHEGDVEPSSVWRGHDDAIGGLGLHPGGAGVLATCAGSRHLGDCISPKRDPGKKERGVMEASDESSDTDSSSSSDVVSVSSTSSVSDSSVSNSSASESISQPPAEAGLKIWAL